jgi:aldose 1-epimerase
MQITGTQYKLTRTTANGVLSATISSVAASLREFSVGEIELVEPYGEHEPAPYCAGQVMSPWVNRLDHGKWTYQGQVLSNPITIVDQDNANHGLLLDHSYDLVEQSENQVTLLARIEPTEGYPFTVETEVTYALVDDGLVVTHRAVNLSSVAAPYATGAHPYFKFGTVDAAELTIRSAAATLTKVDDRQIPVGLVPTINSEFDLRAGVRLAGNHIDQDFTDLPRDAAGLAHTYLTAPDGRGIDVWQDQSFKHVVIFTPNYFPTIEGETTHAAAIEPSTAAPNAFNNGQDLLWLEPGQSFEATWGVTINL